MYNNANVTESLKLKFHLGIAPYSQKLSVYKALKQLLSFVLYIESALYKKNSITNRTRGGTKYNVYEKYLISVYICVCVCVCVRRYFVTNSARLYSAM